MSKPRAQLKHMLMDVDFFDKPTVRALGFKHTQVAILLYVRWLMLMSRATNALVTRDALASIAREVLHGMGTSVATFETVLDYCLETGMVFEESPGMYTNERVVNDQESCAVKRIGATQRQAKHRDKKEDSGNALVTRLPVYVSDTVIVTDPDLNLENSHPELTRAATGMIQARDHVWVNSISIDNWKSTHGEDVVERALDVLNGDIEAARGTPDFPKKQRMGRDSAAGPLQKWCFSEARIQLEREKRAAPNARAGPRKSQAEKNQDTTIDAMKAIFEEVAASK